MQITKSTAWCQRAPRCTARTRTWRQVYLRAVALCPSSVLLGSAELMPVGFGEVDLVVASGSLDVRKCQSPICVRDIDHLIESCHGVAHMLRIGERLLALTWEGENAVRQVATQI